MITHLTHKLLFRSFFIPFLLLQINIFILPAAVSDRYILHKQLSGFRQCSNSLSGDLHACLAVCEDEEGLFEPATVSWHS